MKMRLLLIGLLALFITTLPACAVQRYEDSGNGHIVAYKNELHNPGAAWAFTGWFYVADDTPDNPQHLFGSSTNANEHGIRLVFEPDGVLRFGRDHGTGTTQVVAIGSLTRGWHWIGLAVNDNSGVFAACIDDSCVSKPFHYTGGPTRKSEHNLFDGANGMGDWPPEAGNKLTSDHWYFGNETWMSHVTPSPNGLSYKKLVTLAHQAVSSGHP